jgi:hypothetical protein
MSNPPAALYEVDPFARDTLVHEKGYTRPLVVRQIESRLRASNETRAPHPPVAVVPSTGLWRPETHNFDGPRLLRAIVARGWTIADFADAAHLHAATVYNAVQGRRVRDATAIAIFETLEKRQPMQIAAAG